MLSPDAPPIQTIRPISILPLPGRYERMMPTIMTALELAALLDQSYRFGTGQSRKLN
ncbi:hypothetical protein [Mycobacteroides abscessus]|uniref:hypothetical protein n=1 Tax=Mycobacteroides abscessus TaxID=36809 RepID=UPI0013F5D88F|nr:hypothetical protein [Mycobacteroides abscessus]